MMRQAKYLFGAAALIAALAGGWVFLSQATQTARDRPVALADHAGIGALDGMTFSSELGLTGKPSDVHDQLIFQHGLFVSTECDRRCGYPAQPYFARQVGDRIEFLSEAQCLHKDATIVWRGTVEDGTISGTFTWTVNRWYWTLEKEFWFKGKLVAASAPKASN